MFLIVNTEMLSQIVCVWRPLLDRSGKFKQDALCSSRLESTTHKKTPSISTSIYPTPGRSRSSGLDWIGWTAQLTKDMAIELNH